MCTICQRFIRVGAAEDKEGASFWDRNDLLLLYQIRDDWPRPRWNLCILLLPRCVIVVLIVLLTTKQKLSEFSTSQLTTLKLVLQADLGYLVIFVVILFVSVNVINDSSSMESSNT